jgi:cell division transport system permease protein
MNDANRAIPPDSQLKRDMPLVPEDSIAGRALVVVIAIMTFLACLTAGGAILVSEASEAWRGDVSRDVTIQIKPRAGEDVEALVAAAAEIASRAPGVADAVAYTKAQSEAMLAPWLGDGVDLSQLPIPRLIVVHMQADHREDLEPLRAALAAGAPQASLDDHRLWLSRLDTMADAIVVFAGALFALMIVAMATAVGFATRGAMAGAREIVEVLHFVGAADSRPPRGGDWRGRGGAVLRRRLAGFPAGAPFGGGGRNRRLVRRLPPRSARLRGDRRGRRRHRLPHRASVAQNRLSSAPGAIVSERFSPPNGPQC